MRLHTQLLQIAGQGGGRLVGFSLLFLVLSAAVPYAMYRELGGHWPALDSRLLSPAVIGTCFVLLAVYFVADGLRLYFAVRALGYRVPAEEMARLVFINFLFSNITPMATGGGFAQIWYLRAQGVHLGAATAATTLRTLLASLLIFLPALLLMSFSNPLQNSTTTARWVPYLGLFAVLYLGIFTLALTRMRWMMAFGVGVLQKLRQAGVISDRQLQRWRFSLRREMVRFASAIRAYLKGPRRYVVLSVLSTALFLLALFSFPALLLWSLGYRIDYLTVIGLMVVTTFVMYFSPTPGAAGIAEGIFALFFADFVTASDLVLVVIAWRALTVNLGMLIGVPVTVHMLAAGARK